ncbi:MAG: iron ABC transporter permease [Anaerolineales bacterium]|nr:iron ABC transporter permease [Anaerolineales bacterium]
MNVENKNANQFTGFCVYLSTYKRILLWLPAFLFLLSFFFYPLTKIISLTFDFSTLTNENNLLITRNSLLFTFYQAALSTILTFILGIPSAILFSKFDFHGKSLLRALTAIPFMLPTVVVAAAFNAFLGSRGLIPLLSSFLFPQLTDYWLLITDYFQPATFNFILILLAHVFYNTTIVIRIVGNAISQLDSRLENSARVLGADLFRTWRYVTFPLLQPALLASALLVFMFNFTSFGVILLLGGSNFSTLEVEIYIRALQLPNLNLAAMLSIIQLFFTLIFSIFYTRTINKVSTQTSQNFSQPKKPKTFKEKIFVTALCLLLSAFFILPLLSLPIRSLTRLEADRGQRDQIQYGFTTEYYQELFINRRNSLFYVPPFQATINSLSYAGITVLFSLAIGYPVAVALAKPTQLEKFLDPLLLLPLGSSAVMLGLGFIISFGRLISSPFFVPIAHTLIALPFVIRTLQPAIKSIPEKIRQAASTLGASPFRVWQTIDFPILSRATLTAATFAFTISLGEFGATLLINRPEYPTIPIAIQRFLSQPGGLNYGQAMAMATLLMIITTISILFIEKLRLNQNGEF